MTAARHARLLAVSALAVLLGTSGRASAVEGMPGDMPAIGERGAENVPLPELEGVDVTEQLGAELPLDATLVDEDGAPVRLRDLFGDGLPVVLTFNYSSCPMLCNVMLGGLTRTLVELDWTAGTQFKIVTISLDPTETPARAKATQAGYLERYGRPGTDRGWRFLTATPETVRALADRVGLGYRIVARTGEVLHPAVLILVSPQGVVSRYVYGVEFDKAELRAALTATALGTITESTSRFLHACFSYEAPSGFAAVAMKVMRFGGLVFVLGLAAVFVIARLVRTSRAPKVGHAGSH